MGSHWTERLKEVATYFYYQHLKTGRSPRVSNPHLFFFLPPNDMYQLYVILSTIIIIIDKNQSAGDERWIS